MKPTGSRGERWHAFVSHLRTAPGHLSVELREASVANHGAPNDFATFVDTIARHAYRVTDAQVDALRQAGYTEDQIFEAAVIAAAGEADRRLQAALDAMAAS